MNMTASEERLTAKQENFCLAYLETGNASEAYRRAYSAEKMKPETIHKRASELLADGEVSGRIAELQQAAASAAVMSRQEALERLSGFARIDLADLIEFAEHEVGVDENGQSIIQTAWRIKDSAMQDPKKLAAIAELSAGRDGIKIKTHSPLQAIQQLAKMQGWESATKHELSGPGGTPMTPSVIVLCGPDDGAAAQD